MRTWLVLLGGLLLWTVHFFTLYAIGSVLLSTLPARVLTLLATLACLAGIALLARWIGRGGEEGWTRTVGLAGAAISAVAIVWQGLPALLA